jgi:hypothetical protein
MKIENGNQWGTILVAVLIFGAVGYLGYQALKPIEPITSLKNKEDERE